MSLKNSETLSQIVAATSGRKMGRDKYRKTCNGRWGHLWSNTMRPVPLEPGFAFQYCVRCGEVKWM